MILQRLKDFLDSHQIKYTVHIHSQAYTALEVAALARIPGKELAKTVMVNADGKMMMVVLPASHMIDFHLLRKVIDATNVELAGENEFKNLFPECEVGAMPPFGDLFNMPIVVSSTLAEDEMIAFNAGTHRELVKMTYRDFAQLVLPKIGTLSIPKRYSIAGDSWEVM